MRKLISLYIALLLLVGCQPKQENIAGIWFYTYSDKAIIVDDKALTPASFLYLNDNGEYSSFFGGFDHGKWEFADQQLKLKSANRNEEVLRVKRTGAGVLSVDWDDRKFELEKQAGKFDNPSLNPFSSANNQWRTKATQKESPGDIKKRILNHFRFQELYFRWALDNGFSSLDVRSTPSLIKIYGNGFSVVPYDELTEGWKSNFYDEEECRLATTMITKLFQENNIAWSKTENKFKMFISAFQQLQQQLAEQTFNDSTD